MKTKPISSIISNTISRRSFFGRMAMLGAGMTLVPSSIVRAQDAPQPDAVPTPKPLLDSPPILQCPSDSSISIVWAVGMPATGYVEYGSSPSNLNMIASGAVFGQMPYHERVLHVRITGLQPNTKYYYRVVCTPFEYKNFYSLKRGDAVYGDVHSFTTSGTNTATASFSVINDTHAKHDTLDVLDERLKKLAADYTIWNGDLMDGWDSVDAGIDGTIRHASFATDKPLLFVPGNHDYRGSWARNTSLIFPPHQHYKEQDSTFGRNFVVRQGPLAMIGLDTGEDKPDAHPAWAGMARFEPYIEAQAGWLERALQGAAVSTAPYVVAFCHIPIFNDTPKANGGDSLEGYASFQRKAGALWGPLLTRYGVQAVVVAHTHRFKYDAPTSDRTWAQVNGGGPNLARQVTIVSGRASSQNLEISAENVGTGEELGRWAFSRRKV